LFASKGLRMSDERPTEQTAEPQSAPAETRTVPPPSEQATLSEGGAGQIVPPELTDHPRYQIESCIGHGGMGMVFRARHKVMERQVALKVMRADLTGSSSAFDRFSREVKAAAALSHPNIVAAYDAEQAGRLHFLVMEYVEGSDLAKVVAERGPLPAAVACHYVYQAALGLQHAFEKGMIHRDIKPQNLMLARESPPGERSRYPFGQVKVLDFGLARLAQAVGAETASGVLLGTVDFMAPEQANDARSADIRSDIYSLGCTLYYLLAGRPMFPDGTLIQRVMAHVERQAPPITTFRADLPAGLPEVINKALAKDPSRRYQTPAELAAALTRFAGVHGDFAPPLALPAAVEPLEVLPVLPAEEPTAAMPKPSAERKKKPAAPPVAAPKPRRSRFLLGCFVITLALIASATFLGHELIQRMITVVEKQMSESRRSSSTWETLELGFIPPDEDADDDELFPRKIGEFERIAVDGKAAIPELKIDLKGRHAEYRSGSERIQISVFTATSTEKENMYNRALKALERDKNDKRGGFHSVSGSAQSSKLSYHVVDPRKLDSDMTQRGTLWWAHDRLFSIRTPVSVDPEPLLLDYLQQFGAPPRPEPPADRRTRRSRS
jgi:serine/threonine protein kinase